MPLPGEQAGVQNPFIRYATEAGWTYLSVDDALSKRNGGITSPVLDALLVNQLQKLNPGIVDYERAQDAVKRFVRVRPSIEGNLDAWEYLKGLKTVFVAEEKRERNIRLIDPVNVDANTFHVTDEFTFSNGTPPDIRADIVFFINGVPVVVVETKRASHAEGIAEALDDIRYYHKKGPEFLALSQLHALTHLIQFYYGATWTLTRKSIFNWRDENAPKADFETLCKTFVAPRRVLRVLSDYILFTRKDDELSKVVLRPHQMRAVERCLARARDGKKRRGLIWHTQGSGKTYTMITTAKRLLDDPKLENPTVLMLVDRNELEEQLFKNLEQCGFGHVEIAGSKRSLEKLLKDDRRGLIVTMIHKFEGMAPDINKRPNIYVLVDEAHRTTGGDLGNYMMGAIPNATYLGFTGTPIDKTAQGRGTFKTFGTDDDKGYLDKYSIKESIQDGTTVPLHYALAPNELRVDKETLEKEFFSLAEAEGVSDIEELNKVLEKAVTLRNMLKNRDRVKKVAKFIAEHFTSTVQPMGYKAFIVAVDREACCLMKEAIDAFLPPELSRVVISSGGKKDAALLRKYWLTDDGEKDVRQAFRRDEQPQILIVTEKLLTGFDVPHLYCMYLDKPMRDHVLLQAIARVNRPYEDGEGRKKPSGFVLDFVGIFENLEKALAFDSRDVSGVIEGVDILQQHFDSLVREARAEYLPVVTQAHGKSGKAASKESGYPYGNSLRGDKAIEAVLEEFRDKEKRQKFYAFFKELQDIYEILSPDAFLRPYLPDYGILTDIYYTLRAAYDRGITIDKEFQRKTAHLVQEHTQSGAVEKPTDIHALDENALKKIAGDQKPDTVKVFNLLKAIHAFVSANSQTQPYLISIGERAEQVARLFEERQMTTQQALEALDSLVAEFQQAKKSREQSGLSPEGFAVFWFLKREGAKNPEQIAAHVANAFGEYPHWQTSERQEQEVRRCLYKSLIDSDVDGVVDVATKLMQMLKRAGR